MNMFKICEGCTNQKADPALECTPDDCKKYNQKKPKVMAEMTAEEAKIFIAQELKALSGPEGCCVQTMQRNQTKKNNLRGLAALIEQQAATIEAMKCCGNCKHYVQHCQEGYKSYEQCECWEQVKEGQ